MNFTEAAFPVFFVSVFFLYWLFPRRNWQNPCLLVASYVFYGWVEARLAILLGIFTLVNYLIGRLLELRRQQAYPLLILGIGFNLGFLGLFKYLGFFIEATGAALQALGFSSSLSTLQIVLPLGVSFFTLQAISYLVDLHRGQQKPEHNLVDFGIYLGFFPKLVAGPIERAKQFLPQLKIARQWDWNNLYRGSALLLLGYLQKVMVADNLANVADQAFWLIKPPLPLLAAGTFAYTVQILADFAGYTAIARGLAVLLGINLVENFNAPYVALTPGDFWNRWHMSFSKWLRDYIFFPFGRWLRLHWPENRKLHLLLPPLVTFIFSGLWHGTGWTFFAWGVYWAVLIIVYELLGRGAKWRPEKTLSRLWAWVLMFCAIMVGWAFFRAPSLEWLAHALLQPDWGLRKQIFIVVLSMLSATFFYSLPLLLRLSLNEWKTRPDWADALFYAAALVGVLIFIGTSTGFIYAKF